MIPSMIDLSLTFLYLKFISSIVRGKKRKREREHSQQDLDTTIQPLIISASPSEGGLQT